VNPATRDQVIADVKAFRKSVLSGDRAVRQILQSLYAWRGLDWDRLNEQWADQVREMNFSRDTESKGSPDAS
jgi:hypothetical protein